MPVLVDNDANLMAYAEQRAGHPDCAAFLLVKVSTGIGAGVVVDGQLYRGIDGGAGDIGHIRLHDCPDALCMCGSYGCLAAVASGRALAGQLADTGIEATSGSGVREHLAAGQPDAVRLAREAGRRVGEVLVTVVTLLNPGVLMIAGDLAGTPFLTGRTGVALPARDAPHDRAPERRDLAARRTGRALRRRRHGRGAPLRAGPCRRPPGRPRRLIRPPPEPPSLSVTCPPPRTKERA